jgi:hypothetical protein
MTSFRQIEANRRDATKSTRPVTQEGKQRSRCNAVRHGLTAETVIGALEDSEDYKAFEAAIVADYDAQTTVERELVLRLASLLWRLRRATTTETGLFEIEANHAGSFRQARQSRPASPEIVYAMLEPAGSVSFARDPASHDTTNATETGQKSRRKSVETAVHPAADLARCFLRLANLPNYALDRLSRDPVERIESLKSNDPRRQRIADLFRIWWEHHEATPLKANQLADPVKAIADPHGRGRQFLATFLSGLAGTHAAGFVLTRQEPAGKWAAATYQLTKAEPAGAIRHRPHRTDEFNSPEPVAPVRPMGPMPDDLDGGAVPAGTEAEI